MWHRASSIRHSRAGYRIALLSVDDHVSLLNDLRTTYCITGSSNPAQQEALHPVLYRSVSEPLSYPEYYRPLPLSSRKVVIIIGMQPVFARYNFPTLDALPNLTPKERAFEVSRSMTSHPIASLRKAHSEGVPVGFFPWIYVLTIYNVFQNFVVGSRNSSTLI
ncbi:uncharacterized protein ARMOST_21385 [Armillaria ostoyae]|uniref:Uncharacterized protein n=1 Tax=Armillaria ostoyae TaxID=47428 RepID=A0A284S9Z5_ARMOS|nr:uncharacterized protein ARMOST_21385 [Armillaria ostoyae]